MIKYLTPFVAALVLVVLVLLYAYVYLDIQKSAVTIADAREQIAAIAARDSFAKSAAQFLSQTVAERGEVLTFVTAPNDTAGAIGMVEDAARLARVKASVSSATISAREEPHLEQLDVVVSAEGSFVAQTHFATVLESLPRGAKLTQAHLEASDNGWFATYTVSFIKIKAP